ncbi:MAG: chromate transporter [Eubacteriaceae bacterium]|nr:chromate transporter [Eubacteriaceae bacterium]
MGLFLNIFLTMTKFGFFAFGGGYAMIALFENEFVSSKKWITHSEFMDVVAIAESTPGPIAINVSTYVGYKLKGFWGSLVATTGMCGPSFLLMYLVSLYYDQFMANRFIYAAFKGIQVCVIFLIASAGIKILKKIKKTPANLSVLIITGIGMIAVSLFSLEISSVVFILFGAAVGIAVYLIDSKKKGRA